MSQQPHTVYLARHATPDWTRTDIRYDVPPGPPLTAQGEAEAVQLGSFLRDAGVQRIYSSPMERTQRTAAIATTVAGVPVASAPAITEWQRGEPEHEVLARMQTFWDEVAQEDSRTGPIALVTHGGPIRILLEAMAVDKNLLAEYRRRFDHDNPLPPAGVWQATRTTHRDPWSWELIFTPEPVTSV